MKEITQTRFLLKYSISLIFYTEIFMLLAILIIIFSNMSMFPTLLVLFLAPLLGGIISLNIVKKNKKLLLKNNIQNIFFIFSVILYTAVYFFNLRFHIILVSAYIIGAVVGILINRKKINQVKSVINEETKIDFFKENQKIKIKSYEFEKFNIQNIKEFLKINKIEGEKFILSKIRPIKKEYVLWNDKAVLKYLLYYDDKNIYFFEITNKTKEYIEKGFAVDISKINVQSTKEGIFNYNVEIEYEEGSKCYLYLPKKSIKVQPQMENSKELFDKLIKCKAEQK